MSVLMIEDKRIAIRSVDNEKSTIRSSSELRDHVNNCRKLEAARNFRNELHAFVILPWHPSGSETGFTSNDSIVHLFL